MEALKYTALREHWINLRKNKNKSSEDIKKQKLIGLIIDKTVKAAKKNKDENIPKYIFEAIKSEYKQQLDSLNSGVDCQFEVNFLKKQLPKKLPKEETKKVIEKLISELDNPNMGMVMKELKKVSGIDMKIAATMVKELL